VRSQTSLRTPEERLRSERAAPVARALRVAVPKSSSEPAMRRADPESVTSEMDWPPASAAREDCRSATADGGGEVCWPKAGRRSTSTRETKTMEEWRRTGTSMAGESRDEYSLRNLFVKINFY